MKKRKLKKIYRRIVVIGLSMVCLVIFFYSSFQVVQWFMDNKKQEKIAEELKEVKTYIETVEEEEQLSIDFDMLLQKNKDTVGWIELPSAGIDYPVVQASNNVHYLKRDFYQKANEGGSIFMDYRNDALFSDQNTVIYGHSRGNGTMFGSLKKLLENGLKQDSVITYHTKDKEYKFEIFSIYRIAAEDYYITPNFSSKEYATFLETIKKRSNKQIPTTVSHTDTIITLSTCADTAGKDRVVLHAKLVSEKEMKYN